jgi:formate-dependent nitrite reductase cytochrome c552 subunit
MTGMRDLKRKREQDSAWFRRWRTRNRGKCCLTCMRPFTKLERLDGMWACRRCRSRDRRRYRGNPDYYHRTVRTRVNRIYRKVNELKARTPCRDCGNSFPSYVMDFDHRDPSTKIAPVATLISRGSEVAVWEEIEKCDVVCSNCHRIRTWKGKVKYVGVS